MNPKQGLRIPQSALNPPSSGQSNTDIGSQVEGFFAFSDLGSLVPRLIDAAIIAGALAALLYLIMGGMNWIMAGGDAKKVEEAQKHLTNAIIGLIILVASYAIFQVVKSFLGLDSAIITN